MDNILRIIITSYLLTVSLSRPLSTQQLYTIFNVYTINSKHKIELQY